MSKKGPGKSHRDGISITKLIRMFPNDEAARKWFEDRLWKQGPHCPYCGSFNVQCNIKHKTMTHRCRDCERRPMFSLKTGNIMEGSKLGYQTWAIAIYLVTTSLNGVSSMKLHRDLEITQKSAWHLSMRLRKCMDEGVELFKGPIEVDETHVGGKRRNMPKNKRKELAGSGPVGKTAFVGAKDRDTNKVAAMVAESTDAPTLQGFAEGVTTPDATGVYDDDAKAHVGMDREHESVNHSAVEYVKGMAHANGIESLWSMVAHSYRGTFQHFSKRHMHRYIAEFTARHNFRKADTMTQIELIAERGKGKRLRYEDLVA
ncbi:MAG: IS1595 family transposase [Boseongicola sp. SB0675_bin_26]|nr:IS1595 family transposase [Boseongicola sp. SB0665_bin_10]MYA37926.1 IS1595 family transposase [Gammaproteobacteria bacterium]MYH58075.1 IS1595 family transposase [Boseongicola sp. SB0675_bin_26]